MAEVSRSNIVGGNVRYPTGAAERNEVPSEPDLSLPELPERATPANNPALNRSAEVVGRSVGAAVAGVRSLPRQFGKLRSRIHLVPRGSSSESVRETVEAWQDTAEQKIGELKDRAESYSCEVADRASHRLEDLRRRAEWGVAELRRSTRGWLAGARRLEADRPFHVIAGCAAAAFMLGVALRIRRSNSD